MIKIVYKFRFFLNWILSRKLLNNKYVLKTIKKFYSFLFTRKGIKNMEKYVFEIDKKIRNILLKYNGYLGCGNCLFLARNESSFGNNDLDYCIQLKDMKEYLKFIEELEEIGFKHINTLYHNDEPIELKFSYKSTYFDVFLLKVFNDFCISKTILLHNYFPKLSNFNNKIALTKCAVIEQKWPLVSKVIFKNMNGYDFIIPENYEQYLIWQYGYNWRTPIKNFNFLENPKNNLPKIYDYEGVIVYENN